METSPRRVAFFYAIVLAVLVGLFEIGANVVLRATHGYDGEHLLQYSFDPYKNIVPTPGYRDIRGVTHNSAGFRRQSEVSLEKPDSTIRIFLMGGSTAFGTGGLWTHIEPSYPVLNDSVTIDRYMEEQLNAAAVGVRYEVINAAIPSTWTHHSFIYLAQRVLRYKPDAVVFLDGFNDFFQCDPSHEQFASYAYGERAGVIMGPPTLMALVQANGWWLTRKSAAAYLTFRTGQKIAQVFSSPGERPPIDVDACLAEFARLFPENALAMWRRSAVMLEAEGVDALFLLQPMLMLERERPGLTDIERQLLTFDVQSWPAGREPYLRRAAPLAAQLARPVIAAAGQHFLDLTGIFSDATTQMFTDYAHLTPAGNERLALIVTDTLRTILGRQPD